VSKSKILGEFDGDQIPYVVPPDYKERVRLAVRPGGAVHRSSIRSRLRARSCRDVRGVRRAIDRIPMEASLLAVGADFTEEATELLHAREAAIARIGEFR
jgi:hypothetical protein